MLIAGLDAVPENRDQFATPEAFADLEHGIDRSRINSDDARIYIGRQLAKERVDSFGVRGEHQHVHDGLLALREQSERIEAAEMSSDQDGSASFLGHAVKVLLSDHLVVEIVDVPEPDSDSVDDRQCELPVVDKTLPATRWPTEGRTPFWSRVDAP